MVALALVFGVSAAAGIGVFVNSRTNAPAVAKTWIVVAKTELVRGIALKKEQLELKEVPSDMVLKGSLTSIEDAEGRVAFYPLSAQEPLLDHKLNKKGAPWGVSASIPKGMRAFTIQNTKVAGASSGFLQPGDKVDVLAVGNAGSRGPGGAAVTLLSKIEVLTVDQITIPSGGEAKVNVNDLRSLTLLVTPKDAEKLTEAQTTGSLQVTLRNPEDEVVVAEGPEQPKQEPKTDGSANPQTPPAVVTPRLVPASIRTLRGSDEGTIHLEVPSQPGKR
ncbi:MAG: Flp pilus assembly protein CpaB [Chloroflexota bacterium]